MRAIIDYILLGIIITDTVGLNIKSCFSKHIRVILKMTEAPIAISTEKISKLSGRMTMIKVSNVTICGEFHPTQGTFKILCLKLL